MTTLKQILTDVAKQPDVMSGVLYLIEGLHKQVDDAIDGVLSAEQQSKVDAVFTAVQENKGKVEQALQATRPPTAAQVPPVVEPPIELPPPEPGMAEAKHHHHHKKK